MRYFYIKPKVFISVYGQTYLCNHPVYSCCTLYLEQNKGLAVIQQRFNAITKRTWWGEIDSWLTDDLYLHPGFKNYFTTRAKKCTDGLYPTITVRQLMWALKMKPLKRERWETVFDRREI